MIEWQWRVFFFVRAADATEANKNALANIYVNNGGMETLQNELKMFDGPIKFSTTGNLPAQAFGFNSPAKTAMRDGFKALLDNLTNARYAVVDQATGELVRSNMAGLTLGRVVTWEDAVASLNAEFGLQVIPAPVEGP